MAAALAGLVVGARRTGAGEILGESRRRAAASRTAARLLFGYVWQGQQYVEGCLDTRTWQEPIIRLERRDWEQRLEALAGAMAGMDFFTVDGALAAFEHWQVVREREVDGQQDTSVRPDLLDEMQKDVDRLKEAAAATNSGGVYHSNSPEAVLITRAFSRSEQARAEAELLDNDAEP